MKHRADVLQIERPGSTQTGGRHAVAKKGGGKAAKAAVKAVTRGAAARKLDPELEPQPTEPELDPQLLVVAGEEGTLAGDVEVLTEQAHAAATATVLTVARPTAPLRVPEVEEVEETAPAALLETTSRPEAAAMPTQAEKAASPLTSTGKWRTRNLMRNVTFVLLVGAAVATGLAGRYYFESTTDSRMRLLITSCLVVAGLWALLTATAPQVVTLKGSILTVKSRRRTDRFDLAEGMQQLELIGEPTSSKWALVLHRGDNTIVRLGRRDVDARTLDPLVRSFREIAERRRSEHWARMGL